VKYWFLTMGTNDLCGGAAAFSANAQTWINAVKAAGATPILVHPIWGNNSTAYCSQNGPSFNTAVDALVNSNGLLPAVRLYEATVGHPEYFDPGDVHPNSTGCAVWNKTFADAVSSFYP
jgi:lysophospholipase L1-like esterase